MKPSDHFLKTLEKNGGKMFWADAKLLRLKKQTLNLFSNPDIIID